MSAKDYTDGPVKSGVLSSEEMLNIYRVLSSPTEVPSPKVFSDIKRVTQKVLVCTRFTGKACVFGTARTQPGRPADYLTFTVDKPITVIGFGCYGTTRKDECFDIKFNLEMHGPFGVSVSSGEMKIVSNGIKNPTRVDLPVPVDIPPSTIYCISLSTPSCTSLLYQAKKGLEKVTNNGVTFKFVQQFLDEGHIPQIY